MSIEMIQTNVAPTPVGPYAQATKVQDLLFISGIIPIDPATNTLQLFENDAAKQTELILQTLQNFLASQGLSANHVVKTTIFLANMDDFAAVNQVYAKMFTDHKPARACVEVSRLPKDVVVEIEAIACCAS